MKIGSLFSGYGGLDLAVEAITGATPAWFCEWDEAPSKILNHHWPQVPNLRDVTQVDWSQVEPVDIITGGSPCQDLSSAGRRAGMTDGTRSNLWVNMREAIAIIKPQLVVWENVLGALSASATSDSDMEPSAGLLGNPTAGHLRALGRVLGDLTEIGYDTKWTTVRASDVGAPHHRARIFLIAWPTVQNPGRERGGQGTVEGTRGETPQRISPTNRPHNPNSTPPNTKSIGYGHGGDCGSAGKARIWPIIGGHTTHAPNPKSVRRDRGWATPKQASRENPATYRYSSGINWGEYAPAVRRWERIVGPAPAPTEPNSKGNPRLNAAFAEWMMGLPVGHVTAPEIGLTRAEQLKAIGNGVCPQQAEAALLELLQR